MPKLLHAPIESTYTQCPVPSTRPTAFSLPIDAVTGKMPDGIGVPPVFSIEKPQPGRLCYEKLTSAQDDKHLRACGRCLSCFVGEPKASHGLRGSRQGLAASIGVARSTPSLRTLPRGTGRGEKTRRRLALFSFALGEAKHHERLNKIPPNTFLEAAVRARTANFHLLRRRIGVSRPFPYQSAYTLDPFRLDYD